MTVQGHMHACKECETVFFDLIPGCNKMQLGLSLLRHDKMTCWSDATGVGNEFSRRLDC